MKQCLFVVLVFVSQTLLADGWVRHTIDDSSRGADGVRLADVNGDGQQDIVTGWEEGGVIRAYLNPGPKKAQAKWPAVTVGKVKSPEDAVFGDLDGDGAVDVVSSCEGRTRTMFIHWAPRDRTKYLDPDSWKTNPIDCTAQKQMWMFALPMQVDEQNGVDLIVSSKGGGATIGWLQSPQDPRDATAWKFHELYYKAGWIMSLQAHDMDKDGDMDVLASDRKGANRGILWLENPGAKKSLAGTSWIEHRVGASDREVMFLTVADLDQNGTDDILCTVRGRGISVLKRDGEDKWSHQEIPMPANCGTGKGVAVTDIDLDGKQDIVFSCENASAGKSGMRWLSSPNGTDWKGHEISGSKGVKFDRIELLDLDQDGDQDVICCEERDNLGVIWYENPTK